MMTFLKITIGAPLAIIGLYLTFTTGLVLGEMITVPSAVAAPAVIETLEIAPCIPFWLCSVG